MRPKFLLQLLLWLILQASSAMSQLTAYTKLCKTLELTDLDYHVHLNATRLRQRLAEMVNGCQYVNGDLIISWMGVDRTTGRRLGGDIREMPTDFLDSVVEITGRLVVTQSNLGRLELRNLRAIRGHSYRGETAAIELVQCAHPVQLVLPRLAAINKGGVELSSATDQNLYCYATRGVAWSKLFQSSRQRLSFVGVRGCTQDSGPPTTCNCTAVACHSSCGGSGCFAPDAAACQTSGRCQKRSCGTCYVDPSSKEEECCHSSCLGGCNGPSAKDCFSCRVASYNGECREGCPKEEYDTATAKVIASKEPMVQVGNICMRTCPPPFLLDSRRRYCIAECPDGELPVGGNCTACSDRTGQPCRVCETNERLLGDELAQSFTNCSVWKLESSFNVDGSSMSDESWQSLASARIIYTSALIFKRTEARASNLTVLRKLSHVSGSLILNQLTATHLGLSGLKSAKSLAVDRVQGLCAAWFPSSFLKSGAIGFPVSLSNLKFADNSSAECAFASCHSLCRSGCWGPGPDLCVACTNATVDGTCYADCRLANHYSDPDGGTECLPCHPECGLRGGCSGPGAHQCATCRRHKQDGVCVPVCSSHLESDSSGMCYSASTVRLGLLAGGLALLVLLLLGAGVMAWFYYQRRVHKYDMVDLDEYLGDASNPNDMAQLLIVNDDDLVKNKEIGSGAFGTVYKGILRSETEKGYKELPVAIKVLRGSNPKLGQELLNEASVLARVRHPNCVRLVALCLTEEVQLVTNLMPRGCLLEFLRTRQNGISAHRMINWGLQVAEGMAYLESINIVHRDLAARNVLLKTPDEVKITDFGLARLVQNSERQLLYTSGAMPVKWLGLECFESGVFSHKSDVWSFGVLLWEICSYGEAPYKPYRISSVDDISGLLRKGVRLSQPPVCSVDFYNIMLTCWLPNPGSRPNFIDLTATMKECLASPGKYIAYGPGMGDLADTDDVFDDPDAIVHTRERVSSPSAVASSIGSIPRVVGEEGYSQMSVLEPDEKASLMSRSSLNKRAPANTYVNEPMSRHQKQQQQDPRRVSEVQTRRGPKTATAKPPPPPSISTLPMPDDGYLEPIKSPSDQKHQPSLKEEDEGDVDNNALRDSATSKPVELDDDYMVPRDSIAANPVELDDDYMVPRDSIAANPVELDDDYMVPRDSMAANPVELDDDYMVPRDSAIPRAVALGDDYMTPTNC